MPSVTGIIESAIYVADVKRSMQFYKAVLGVDCMDPVVTEEPRVVALNINDRHVFLIFPLDKQFKELQTSGGMIPKHGATGEMHLCFSILKDSLEEWRQHLQKLGVEIESEVKWPFGGTSLYFRDPDHHCIELATPGVWPIY